MLELVTREEWGAKPPKWAYHDIDLYQPTLILHHAAGAILPEDDSVSDEDLRRIRSIQWYHQERQGWNDVAYTFLHDPDGYLFEGRGVGVANGATKGYGAKSYAICVMGHFDQQEPDADLIEGLATTVAWGYEQGWWPLGFTGGHRDYGSTKCPGDNLYPLIRDINELAKEIHEMADRFEDVPTTHTHYKAIEWLAENGITKGTNPPDNTRFSPDRAVSRAEFATLLKRYHNKFSN